MKKSISEYLHKKQKELYAGLMLHLRENKIDSAFIKNVFQSKKDGTRWEIKTTINKVPHDEQPQIPGGNQD